MTKKKKTAIVKKSAKKRSPKAFTIIGLSFLTLIMGVLVGNIDHIKDTRKSAYQTGITLQRSVYTVSSILNEANFDTWNETTPGTNWIGNTSSVNSSYLGIVFKGQPLPVGTQIVGAKFSFVSSSTNTGKLSLRSSIEAISNPIAYQHNVQSSYPSQRQLITASDSFNNREVEWTKDHNYSVPVMNSLQQAVSAGYLSQGLVNLVVKGVSDKRYDFYHIYNQTVIGKEPQLVVTYYLK